MNPFVWFAGVSIDSESTSSIEIGMGGVSLGTSTIVSSRGDN